MEDYQKRVVEEQRDLDEKRAKLASFMNSSAFGGIDGDEQERLWCQLTAMANYSEILGERIAAFKPNGS